MQRNLWIDYLRSFITVLVVAHHAALAYTTFAYFDPQTYIYSTHPVVDPSRWIALDVFVNFNDVFFMPLMFMISGLFVYRGLVKKGRKKFISDRFKRLGIPFIIAVVCIIPIAYLPSFFLAKHPVGFTSFVTDYIGHQQWPVGPPWFIWLLLAFNIIAAWLPAGFYRKSNDRIAAWSEKPFRFILILFSILSLAFIPISLWLGQYAWTGIGPFDFQMNRVLLYFAFFIFGCCTGSGNWEEYLFNGKNLLNKQWPFWMAGCLVCFLLIELYTFYFRGALSRAGLNELAAWFIFDVLFIISCIASSFAFIAMFKYKTNKPNTMWNSLSANAFGIYLLHYVFVTWLQFGLLAIQLPVFVKFSIVFAGSLGLSWLIVGALRTVKRVNQII